MKEYLDIIEVVRKRAHHSEGLVGGIALSLGALQFFGHLSLSTVDLLLLVLIIGSIVAGWLYIRSVPKFGDNEIGILFGPHGDEDVKKDLDVLKTELSSRIKNNEKAKIFHIKTLPPNRVISDVETAVMIRRRSNAILFIWGKYEKGNLQSKELRGFMPGNLNFTYAVPSEDSKSQIRSDIQVGIDGRAWMFSSENELVEREFLLSNVFDVSRYIIGSCLLNFGNVKLGKGILSDILKNPTRSAWKNRNSILTFIENIRAKLARCDAALAYDLYHREIFVGGRLSRPAEKLKEIVALADASLNLKPTGDAYSVKAIALFLLGEMGRAKKALGQYRRRQPTAPTPDYSLGFLFAYEGDLQTAEHYYRRAFEATLSEGGEYIFHLSEFVEATLQFAPEKIHLHYVLGLIHQELIDGISAKRHYERFIELAKGDSSLAEWVAKAGQHIKEIDNPPQDMGVIISPESA